MICLDCAGDLRPVSGPRCYKCGKPVNGDEEYCRDCGAHPGAFDQGRGIFLYDDRMRYSIMKYKYFGCQEYSRFYGKALYIYGKDMLALWKPQIIIPVPLHRRKQRIRGFNQAELLAKELSRYAAFQVVGNPAGMRILLIDDVYTTGSTMDVLAKLLLEKGASHVYFLTLCIGNNR